MAPVQKTVPIKRR